jgi:hypothetical protein
VNIIIPQTKRCLLTDVNRFIRAGDPSPYHDISEVPKSLVAFIGRPDPPPDTSAFEAEQEAILASFSGSINESIEEELERRASEAAADAVALNAISLEQANRDDEFKAALQREHDEEVDQLYQPTKKGQHP